MKYPPRARNGRGTGRPIAAVSRSVKRLLLSLQENIARYEANVGRINIPQGGSKEGIKGFNMGEA